MGTVTVIVCCFVLLVKFATAGQTYNVVDFQAVGDGITDDTQAFLKAWDAVCNDGSFPTLLIPSGKNFLITKTRLEGATCKSSIHIRIDGNIFAPNNIWTTERTNLMTFHHVNRLTIDGRGTIDGQGAIWWDCFNKNKCTRPNLLGFEGCDNLVVRDINLKNSGEKHMSVNTCNNLIIEGITVTAPGDSPNTDGIVMRDCHTVKITGCTIGTGDDCIAILTKTSNVDISRITCGPGHGISIGSLGRGEEAAVEGIHVHDCHISQAMAGVRIKTWQGGSGYARNIKFERIEMADMITPIVIDQFYGQKLQVGDVAISDVTFRAISGTSTRDVVVKLQCSANVPCRGLAFEDIRLARVGGDQTVSAMVQNAYGRTSGTIIPNIPLTGGP